MTDNNTDIVERLGEYAKDWRDRASEKSTVEDAISEIQSLRQRVEELEGALIPFSNPPAYVFDKNAKFVPANMPEHWIGGGWFSTNDFRQARKALNGEEG